MIQPKFNKLQLEDRVLIDNRIFFGSDGETECLVCDIKKNSAGQTCWADLDDFSGEPPIRIRGGEGVRAL